MKRIMVLFIAAVMLFGLAAKSHATLMVRGTDSLGNQLIYDSGLNVTWYDYTKSGDTWQNQVNWATNLAVNFNGQSITGWSLPSTVDGPMVGGWNGSTTAGWNITSSQMGYLFYVDLANRATRDINGNYQPPSAFNVGPFQHLQGYYYWSETESLRGPDWAWYFAFNTGEQWSDLKNYGYNNFRGLAVLPGDVAAVPEPTSLLLLSGGLIGLLAVKKWFIP